MFVSSDTVAPHEWIVDTTELPNGAHTFSVVAFDGPGNTATSAPVQVIVDNGERCDAAEQAGFSCDDGLDNDCDGPGDCDDADCASDASCDVVGCGNGVCGVGESQCNFPMDCGPSPISETNCSDGTDNDCDGLTDCDDIDCASDESCAASGCGDGACEAGEDHGLTINRPVVEQVPVGPALDITILPNTSDRSRRQIRQTAGRSIRSLLLKAPHDPTRIAFFVIRPPPLLNFSRTDGGVRPPDAEFHWV